MLHTWQWASECVYSPPPPPFRSSSSSFMKRGRGRESVTVEFSHCSVFSGHSDTCNCSFLVFFLNVCLSSSLATGPYPVPALAVLLRTAALTWHVWQRFSALCTGQGALTSCPPEVGCVLPVSEVWGETLGRMVLVCTFWSWNDCKNPVEF